jgi:hypothetical protein
MRRGGVNESDPWPSHGFAQPEGMQVIAFDAVDPVQQRIEIVCRRDVPAGQAIAAAAGQRQD